MNTRVRPTIYSAVLCVAILSSGGARAEGFIDVYLGGSYTDDATTRYSSMASATTKFDDSTIGGVRGGVTSRWVSGSTSDDTSRIQSVGINRSRRSTASTYSSAICWINSRHGRVSFMVPTIWPTGLTATSWALFA